MNFKRFHESKNLMVFNTDSRIGSVNFNVTPEKDTAQFVINKIQMGSAQSCTIPLSVPLKKGTYTLSVIGIINRDGSYDRIYIKDEEEVIVNYVQEGSPKTFTLANDTTITALSIPCSAASTYDNITVKVMLNSGSTALPYEPYSSEVWHDTPHYVHNTSTDTITTLPAVVYPNAATATVGLKGQTVQNGTPTPQNPVMPNGCGDRTGQIIEYPYNDKSGIINGVQWTVSDNGHIKGVGTTNSGTNFFFNRNTFFKAGTYTIKIYGKHEGMSLRIYDNVNLVNIASIPPSSRDAYTTFTLNTDTSNECRIYFNIGQTGVSVDIDCDIMLNPGSTALPYEPYGYKIPILSNSTTTPVYLGEVQTTRRIRKYVCTGQESIFADLSYSRFIFTLNGSLIIGVRKTPAFCTHWQVIDDGRPIADVPNNALYSDTGNSRWFIKTTDYTTADGVKSYLADQYANGTPITVWYVLATEETAVVNEPLMKIGDYADEVSGVSIPVTAGGDTLSVDTTVQPSEVTVNYTGWHPAIVHERTNGAWT